MRIIVFLLLVPLFFCLFVNVRFVFASDTLIDSYSEGFGDSDANIKAVHPSSGSLVSARAQSFTMLGSNYKITSAKFSLDKVGSPVGNLVACLYVHSGTYGVNSTVSGGALATSGVVAMAGLGTSYALVEFLFSGVNQYEMVAGVYYVVDVEAQSATTLSGVNYVNVLRDSSSPSHGGNHVYYSNSVWTYLVTSDVCFYVYGVVAGTFLSVYGSLGLGLSVVSQKSVGLHTGGVLSEAFSFGSQKSVALSLRGLFGLGLGLFGFPFGGRGLYGGNGTVVSDVSMDVTPLVFAGFFGLGVTFLLLFVGVSVKRRKRGRR
jgi:hypothetical protein